MIAGNGPTPRPTPAIEWLDWNAPVLRQAAEWLLNATKSSEGGVVTDTVDLRDTLCVTPGRRAGRRLLWHLEQAARDRRVQLIPPDIVTPGEIASRTHPCRGPVARELECMAAWAAALTERGPDRAALGAAPAGDADRDDPLGRLFLAQELVRLEDELAQYGRSWGEVRAAAQRLAGSAEAERWAALERLAQDVRTRLQGAGLLHPVDAQRDAIHGHGASSSTNDRHVIDARPRQVVLIGVVELGMVARMALTALGSMGGRVVALVHASPDARGDFDAFGCVDAEAWSKRPLSITDEAIVVAGRAGDAAQAALDIIGSVGVSAEEMTIGLADPSLAPTLVHAASLAGVEIRPAAGRPITSTEPWQLLARLLDALSDEPEALQGLAVLPTAERWLAASIDGRLLDPRTRSAGKEGGAVPRSASTQADLLAALDRSLRAARPGGRRSASPDLALAVQKVVDGALDPLVGPGGAAAALGAWSDILRNLLARVLEHATEASSASMVDAEAVEVIAGELESWASLPDSIAPRLSGEQALRWLLERTRGHMCPLPRRREQIEGLGWLELHLDDAPVQVIVGLHEGRVPHAPTADHLLPGSLRAELGLPCDATIAARDAYILEATTHARSFVRVVISRTGADGDPVIASRLLLQCEPARRPERLRHLLASRARASAPLARGLPAPAARSAFIVPLPPEGAFELTRMAVTDFDRYLRCPYRYWLERQLRLEAVEALEGQLDAREFGQLVHDVLCAFGRDESISASTRAEAIERWLADALDRAVCEHFGDEPPTVIRVQAARLRERLAAFAFEQATHAAKGWRIHACELALPETTALTMAAPGGVVEAPVTLTGRIDRIDVNINTGEWMILDYKTGENGKTPFEAHHGTRKSSPTWISLQLPLYARHAPKPEGANGELHLGYVLLPTRGERIGISLAPWKTSELDEAIETARAVVRNIRAGRFEPRDVGGHDPFSAICQVNAIGVLNSGGENGDEGCAGTTGGEA